MTNNPLVSSFQTPFVFLTLDKKHAIMIIGYCTNFSSKSILGGVGVRKVRVTLMIEAVNSTVANATTVRGVVGQIDSASIASVATVLPASGSDAAPSAPQAPFVSPYIAVDLNFNRPVLQIRDAQTGDVKQQFPTEARMAQRASTLAQVRGVPAPKQSTIQYVETAPNPASTPSAAVSGTSQNAVQTVSVTTVQEVTATPVSNTATSTPPVAVAALSAASSTASAPESSGVTVYA